jgi:hypothetical protein
MKHILFTMIMANALIILGLSSCKKETLLPSYTIPPIQHYPITMNNLVAGRWIKNERGIYVSILSGVLSGVNTSNRTVKIYLIANNKETQINHSITFMEGKLWAGSINTAIEIDYLPEKQIFPFSYLVIIVVVE